MIPKTDAPDPKAPILLKATPALLDGWCGPVMWEGRFYMVSGFLSHDGFGPAVNAHQIEGRKVPLPIGALYLDLSRAECRDRWGRATGWGPSASMRLIRSGDSIHFYWGGKLLALSVETRGPKPRPGHRAKLWVPALADLDPSDDTRLADGSRLVDTLGLLYVARAIEAAGDA